MSVRKTNVKIAKLFNEKQANKPKVEVVEKQKKIKKKDRVIEAIETRELQYYEYDVVSDIKIYNGILTKNKDTILQNIEFFKQISACDKFTPLIPSTLTSRGEFSNTEFTEEEFIKTLAVPPIKYASIIKIGCNFGEIYTYPNPFIDHPIFTIVKSILALDSVGIIKVGCSCNKELLNTNAILVLAKKISQNSDTFTAIFKKGLKDKISNDKKLTNKKSSKILKNFKFIQIFKPIPAEDITELYNTFETYIVNHVDKLLCVTYLTDIVELIKYFTDYEASCVCSKDFISNKDFDKSELTKNIKTNAQGRKLKKKKTKRKIQGTGLYFSSQITFDIYNYNNKKITKIKVFRNGNYQIPGVKKPDMSDLMESILLTKEYLNYVKQLSIPPIPMIIQPVEIPYIISVMRNYTCRLRNLNINIILNKLEDVLCFEKNMKMNTIDVNNLTKYVHRLNIDDEMRYEIYKYCNVGFYQISEISLNVERYPGLLVKFLRPIPGKETKKLTIKILSSGKINMDGCTSEIEVYEIYYWIQYIFAKYWSEITYDSGKIVDEIVSDDTESGYESIYD